MYSQSQNPSSFVRKLRYIFPAKNLAAHDIRPDDSHVTLLRDAISEINTCKDIFEGWAKEMDKRTSKKPTPEERNLRQAVDKLREATQMSFEASKNIINHHQQFAHFMAGYIDSATKTGRLGQTRETETIANNINEITNALHEHVARIEEDLDALVSVVGDIRVSKTKKSIWSKFLGIFVYVFKALAATLRCGTIITETIIDPITLVPVSVIPAGLSRLATSLAATIKEAENRKEEENLEQFLDFLKQTIPTETKAAQRSLSLFTEGHQMLRVEAIMQSGRRIRLRKADIPILSNDWRTLEQQYHNFFSSGSL